MRSAQTKHREKTHGRQQKPQQAAKANIIHGTDLDKEGDESDSLPMLYVGGQVRQPIFKFTVDGQSVLMKVDTEAAVSVISSVSYHRTAVPTSVATGLG